MRLIIFFILFFGISFSCAKKHYPSGTYNSVFEFLIESDRFNIDTTFTYSLVDSVRGTFKPFNLILPNNLGGKNVRGVIKLYSLIDNKKNLTDIEFLSVELSKKHKPFFYFDIEKFNVESNYSKKLKTFFINALKVYPLNVNRTPIEKVHKTYCIIFIP